MQINNMKTIWLLFLLILAPLAFHAQKTLTGLWTGSLSNDSTTIRKDQAFEIALTQYMNKVYGYSRSSFIVNDTLYYIVKRVKGTINGDVCEIKDDDIISYNFRGKIDKGVKVTTTFRMNRQDSSWHLAGNWSTNQTKRFYSITGKLDLKDEPDIEKSKIFPHLEELNLSKEVPFYVEAKKAASSRDVQTKPVVTIAKKDPPVIPEKDIVKQQPSKPVETIATNKPANTEKPIVEEPIAFKPEPKKTEPVITQKPVQQPTTEVVAVNKPLEEKQKPVQSSTAASEIKQQQVVIVNKPIEQKPKTTESIAVKQEEKKPEVIATKSGALNPEIAIPENKKQDIPSNTIASTEKKIAPVAPMVPVVSPTAAIHVKERKIGSAQEVNFISDSLLLSLYDNGEIDGDTVSVLMNGELILAKQGLKASAIKKTIYLQPGETEFTLVLYAENLGKYAPNTGLLVVYDGEDRYQVRFSADLQQNAAIIFRKKK
jgi:hypothetical protein